MTQPFNVADAESAGDVSDAGAAGEAERPAAAVAGPDAPPEWSLGRRLGVRFVACYLVVYSLPHAAGWLSWIGALPGLRWTAWLGAGYEAAWRAVVPWMGRHVLRLPSPIAMLPNGSGDRTFDYVQVFCIAVIAAVAAVAAPVWTALERRRLRDRRLGASLWTLRMSRTLRVYLRYTLALILIGEGMSLATGARLPFPALDRLQQRIGDSSPLALYSTFMGASPLYAAFTGGVELIGGCLLLFRRTTTLGALLVLGVAANAAALAFSYDVPEKLFCLHLLAMAAVLLAPDARRLAGGLLLDRPTLPPEVAPVGRGRFATLGPWREGLLAAVVLAAIAGHDLNRGRVAVRGPRPPFAGVYEVAEMIRNGRPVTPWSGDPARWLRLIVRDPHVLAVRLADGTRLAYPATFGPRAVMLGGAGGADGAAGADGVGGAGGVGGEGGVVGAAGRPRRDRLEWLRPDPGHLLLHGIWDGDALDVKLRRVDETGDLLVTRGFHLIDDDPINQ